MHISSNSHPRDSKSYEGPAVKHEADNDEALCRLPHFSDPAFRWVTVYLRLTAAALKKYRTRAAKRLTQPGREWHKLLIYRCATLGIPTVYLFCRFETTSFLFGASCNAARGRVFFCRRTTSTRFGAKYRETITNLPYEIIIAANS